MAPSSAFPVPIELVYKELDGIQIAMDVYIPENATKEVPVPVLVWWHGGRYNQLLGYARTDSSVQQAAS
ncbi:hypothetical protein P691DRAFT_55723 [Macrolepiota fuliginosa MF-IS2]|uniref:Carboxylesterase type B domain-containing protein n=1 Tax=Macrolepiota fuliginosa MF-IS2 TaxID=1400762 RepID=A0A9P6BWL7_9AGAR|nr:hypothetical protein P691DRAFT_55723 [Macrolepiota fuliginosa MF-IS2]